MTMSLIRPPTLLWLPVSLALVLAGGTAIAQDAPPPADAKEAAPAGAKEAPSGEGARPGRVPRAGDVQKVFVIRHVDARELARVLKAFPVSLEFSTRLPRPVIAVSGPAVVVGAVEDTIARLDVPPPPERSIEIVAFVVEGLPDASEATDVPKELDGAVAQLKQLFRYPSYRLAETLIARAREGSRFSTEAVGTEGPDAQRFYSFRADRVVLVPGEGGALVRFNNLRLGVEMRLTLPDPGHQEPQVLRRDVGIGGDVDARVGQYAVLGNSGAGEGRGLFLVLRARPVD
jgi:hypothetical protein